MRVRGSGNSRRKSERISHWARLEEVKGEVVAWRLEDAMQGYRAELTREVQVWSVEGRRGRRPCAV